ncbi:MAG: DUF2497 domain-containing protein [Holosporales bacterium]|jgi:cell pole-organizing protein PopZ|nr:DUF2497 domain-containing protein [Holosporales bacterium]
MNPQDEKQSGEMSMDDILSSIRKYVSEEDSKRSCHDDSPKIDEDDTVINLEKSNVVDNSRESENVYTSDYSGQVYEETSSLSENVISSKKAVRQAGPFSKLTDALNSYGIRKSSKHGIDDLTAGELLRTVAETLINDWIDKNLKSVVEEMVLSEIEKMKAE